MKKSSLQLFFVYSLFLAGIAMLWQLASPEAKAYSKGFGFYEEVSGPGDEDTLNLKYDFDDNSNRDPLNYPNGGGMKLNEPSNIKTDINYDPSTGNYLIDQKMGSLNYRPPTYMDKDQYMDYQFRQSVKDYWKQRTHAEAQDQRKPLVPKLRVGGEMFDRIFGGNTVDIRPQGTAELIFALNTSRNQNPAIPVKQRKITTFDFDMRIQLNVIGKIGDKLKISTNYNTQATFDWENQMKLEYTGYEDEIIKKIEAGNVNLPLTGSLITGSQSLFGIKTQLQFGALTVTSVLSQQKGKKSEVKIKGGAQTTRFEVQGDNYEANRHYFLSHFFRDQYNQALANFPVINSGAQITRVEVWVGKQATAGDARNIASFADLGEDAAHTPFAGTLGIVDSAGVLPRNGANSLYHNLDNVYFPSPRDFNKIVTTMPAQFQQVRDYEVFYNARKLGPTEYTFNSRLGFISLNAALNYDEVLSVAFQYTYDGKVYQVGEFSTDGVSGQEPLFVKLLKSTSINSSLPMWDLMMKNIYSIGAYQVKAEEFQLDVIYGNLSTGTDINFLPEGPLKGKPLLWVLKLDRLNGVGSPISTGDGRFDFVDGVTINANNGRVIFPVVEPFGQFLRDQFAGDPSADKYVFNELYDSIRVIAQQSPHKNRFKLRGSYQSASGSDISLGTSNLPQGSVTVSAGSIKLVENTDYTVDYLAGRVKIINEGVLNSGNEITVSLESNALFSIQTRTLLGTHLDYRVNKDFNLGATILHLNERPLTQKVRIGDEPISNTVWGLDGNYKNDAPFLTRLVDKIPLISTKEMSTITASGEFAQFIPGHPKAIGESGNSYLDDFEGSQSNIDIKAQAAWQIASIPQNQPSLFPEASFNDSLPSGFNRGMLNWYTIDPLFFSDQGSDLTPGYYGNTEYSNNFTRQVLETEIFPNKQNTTGQALPLQTLDLAFYPSQRGPYNFDVTSTPISSGLNIDGTLKDPQTRWAGIMRRIETNDFETSNVQFIQFWLMDPFNTDNATPNTTGELYFNLGNVSEDVLKDGRKSFENGLPNSSSATPNYVETNWGRVPNIPTIVDAFDNNPSAREFQDIGLDGLNNADERTFFQVEYLDKIISAYGTSSGAYSNAYNDPSADNYHYYRGDDYDGNQLRTLDRYKLFNGLEGNSPVSSSGYPTQATTLPNTEDLNRDLNMSVSEDYYQYSVKINPQDVNPNNVGSNYITDVVDGTGTLANGSSINVKWYQFKIPIREFEAKFGSMQNFNSIRFIRMFMRGFDKPVVLRFARLELVRGEWRKYPGILREDGIYKPDDGDGTSFNISAVNIEENGNKSPVNYVLPPGIERQVNVQSANLARLNEQAIAFRICNLEDGDARAAFRNMDLDVRQYKKLKFYTHAEAAPGQTLDNGELRVFIRLGSDYNNNYYEYEVPLEVTPAGVYNGTDESQRRSVWPYQNEIEINFSDLQNAKKQRNKDAADPTKNIVINGPSLPYYDSRNNRITVYGNPNLATIKTIVIGVRNPKVNSITDAYDDGLAKCGEVWVNELRLTDFNEDGGWAATGRVTAKMADFATVSLAGTIMTPGYGSLEKKVNERLRETKKSYDVSANVMLGKFVPEKINVQIPMFVGYSEEISTPQYNPLDPDILMTDYRKEDLITSDSLKGLNLVTQDRTIRKSLNFTNVKKERGKGSTRKPAIYDIENFAATYAFNETYRHNSTIELSNQRAHRAGLTWNYNATPKNYKPFAKSKAFKSKHLTIIRDFNFYLFPARYAFTTDVNRTYSELKNRQTISDYSISTIPQYNKTFSWMRNYDLKYDLAKSLKLDFNASNDSRILEPDGCVDNDSVRQAIKEKFLDGGKTMNYKHTLNANYTVPINKLPYMDFVTANVKYGATYGWTSFPIGLDTMGSVIQNTNTKQLNGQLNMVTLYNKVPFLKKINNPPPKKQPEKKKDATQVEKNKKAAADSTNKTKPAAKDTTKEDQYEFFKHVAKVLMSVKTVSFTYSENAGTLLPGYKPRTQYLGMGPNFDGPTPGFVIGSQEDIRKDAVTNDWLHKTEAINTPYTTTRTQTLNLRSNVEPIKDFKIELTANRNFTRNTTEIYRWEKDSNDFESFNPQVNGNFSMSFMSIKTAFRKDDKNHVSETFQEFRDMRILIAQRQSEKRESATGYQSAIGDYPEGYDSTAQDVLIPAFMAAYSKTDPGKITLEDFPKVPIPNWSVRYDGLSKIEALKKIFKTVTLSHAYRSSYSVGNYTTNLNFTPLSYAPGYTPVKDNAGNWQSKNIISAVSISEQFAPLLRIETTLQNSITTNVEYKKDRNLSLATANNQLTELAGREIVIGAGYRFKDLTFSKFKVKGKPIKSDLNLKADFSVKRNETVIRKIVENVNQATAGATVIKISFAADYMITEKVNVRAFYDRIINKPVVSSSFPTSNTNSGISLRLTLQ